MSEQQTYYNEFVKRGAWRNSDEELCGCRGTGWFLSEVDTIHKCSLHYSNQPHPDDVEDGEGDRDADILRRMDELGINAPRPTDDEDILF